MHIFILIAMFSVLSATEPVALKPSPYAEQAPTAQSAFGNETVNRTTLIEDMKPDKTFALRVAEWISSAYGFSDTEAKFSHLTKMIHGHPAWMFKRVVRKFYSKSVLPTYSNDDLLFLLSGVAPWLEEFVANDLGIAARNPDTRTPQNRKQLRALGDRGFPQAQYYVASIAGGNYGSEENRSELEELANKDWEAAQKLIVWDLERRNISSPLFLQYARKGCKAARFLVVKSLMCQETLLEYERQGWEEAGAKISWGLAKELHRFKCDSAQLVSRAERGCKTAQALVSDGLTFGVYGLQKNRAKLIEYANHGWTAAQVNISWELALGKEFSRDPDKLMEYGLLGWLEAQKFVCEGLENGWYGFLLDLDRLMDLANRGWKCAQKTVALGLVRKEYEFAEGHLVVCTSITQISSEDSDELEKGTCRSIDALKALAGKAVNLGEYDSPYLEIYCSRVLKKVPSIAGFLMDFSFSSAAFAQVIDPTTCVPTTITSSTASVASADVTNSTSLNAFYDYSRCVQQ